MTGVPLSVPFITITASFCFYLSLHTFYKFHYIHSLLVDPLISLLFISNEINQSLGTWIIYMRYYTAHHYKIELKNAVNDYIILFKSH